MANPAVPPHRRLAAPIATKTLRDTYAGSLTVRLLISVSDSEKDTILLYCYIITFLFLEVVGQDRTLRFRQQMTTPVTDRMAMTMQVTQSRTL